MTEVLRENCTDVELIRWMGARANFEDEEALKRYVAGYTAFAEFFKDHL